MAIYDVSTFKNAMKSNYGVDNWSKSVDLGNKLNIREGEFTPINEETGNVSSFGQLLQESLSKVNDLQNEANVAMQMLASGKSNNLHETLLAVERADIAFKTMNQVRTKVIDAYKEIMKMQV